MPVAVVPSLCFCLDPAFLLVLHGSWLIHAKNYQIDEIKSSLGFVFGLEPDIPALTTNSICLACVSFLSRASDAATEDAGQLRMQALMQHCRTEDAGTHAALQDWGCRHSCSTAGLRMQALVQHCRTEDAGTHAALQDWGLRTEDWTSHNSQEWKWFSSRTKMSACICPTLIVCTCMLSDNSRQ